MTGLEIWLLAIGLAMDCFAVSIASGIILKRIRWRPMLVMAFFFGFFQALMPFLGWIGASAFSHLIESVDHWIAFAILSFLGGRMILEEMFNGRFYPCETVVADSLRFKQATKASAALMDTLSEHLSKEDYALVEELREQMAIAQCEENESHFKYGFSAGLLVQKEAYEQVAQREKE